MSTQSALPTIDKSLATNIIALTVIVIGYFTPVAKEHVLAVGFFSLSGAVTNWLAIHMLFEKVPFLYGSGVIPTRFGEFKREIRKLIMLQFFNVDNIKQFFSDKQNTAGFDPNKIMDTINFDRVFQNFVDTLMSSPLGSMVGMIGGSNILESMKEPIIDNLKKTIKDIVTNDVLKTGVASTSKISESIMDNIEAIVEQRLDQMTPQMVKIIVQEMIKKHLGWLVVWGGVFGGVIGLLVSFIS